MPPQFQDSHIQPTNGTENISTPKPRSHAFLVALTILMLISGAYAIWYSFNLPPEPEPENFSITKIDEFADWKTYRNEEYGFEFRYPPQYEVYMDTPNTTLVIQPKDKNIKNEPVNNLKIQVIDNLKKVEIREWWNNYGPYTSEAIKKMGFGPTTFPIVDKVVDGVQGIYIGGREGVLTNYLVLPYGDKIIEIQNMIPESQVLSTFRFISTSNPRQL